MIIHPAQYVRSVTPRSVFRATDEAVRAAGSLFTVALCLAIASPAQSTYRITSASPPSVPAGAAGATISLLGTLPAFASGGNQVCFYTGAGSSSPITPSTTAGVVTIAVPASAIQSIDPSGFTAANGYSVPAQVYVVRAGSTCDGTSDPALTNSLTVPIVEPVLAPYVGSTSIPQTNPSTNIQAPPTTILLTGANFAPNTTVSFDTYSNVVSRVLSPTSIRVTVPSSFAAQDVGATASLTVCNVAPAGTAFCSTPVTPIIFTVTSLYPSTAEISATPSPATTADQVVLSATFSKGEPANPLPEPGAPSGTVAFSARSNTIPLAKLILDPTAIFVAQTSTVTTPVAATPVITPAAGSYLNSTIVSLADSTPGATIYYTQDGSTPTTTSTAYTAPFTISTSQAVKAIAAAPGLLNSSIAAAAYTITVSPPAKLAFLVQPANTAINTAIAPAVQVAIQDAGGNTVGSSTLPVSVALAANPAYSTLSGTTTVNAVNGVATFPDLSLNNIANGNTLLAYSGNLTSVNSTAFNITPYPITMAVQSPLIGINSTLNGTITLGHAAPQGGLTVTLTSDTPANVTLAPASLTIAAGQTAAPFTYTGVAAGTATLSASATNYTTGTVQTTATAAQVSLGTIPPVAPGQTASLALSLPTAAPPGGTTVTFTSSNPGVATVTQSIMVPAGQRTAATNPQIVGVAIGTTTITANAPGYAPDTRTATVTVTATLNPVSPINLATSNGTTISISAPAPSGGIAFTLTSDSPSIATLPATVTIMQGATSATIPVTGVADGNTTIRANASGIAEATANLTVSSLVSVSALSTGVHLENSSYYTVYLPSSPPNPVTVTFTIADPSVALISKNATTVGTASLTFPNITYSGYLPQFYLQGQSVGTTTLTVSAPGYTTGTATMTVGPAGFVLLSGDISTTTFSNPSALTVYPALLTAGSNTYSNTLTVNPGQAPINVTVTSDSTAIGTITGSPLIFNGGDTAKTASFQPAGTGTTIVRLGSAPAGFTTPANYQQINATVTAPAIQASNLTTGVNLQNSYYYLGYLPVAPPSPVTVTVTSSDPSVATLSTSLTTVGTATLTFTNYSNAGYLPAIYIQGQKAGTSTLTISAPGYTSGTSILTVYPSGFTFGGQGNFTTTTFSAANGIGVYATALNPGTLTYHTSLPLNPGLGTISVPVASSNTTTGTITTSPVLFNAGDSYQPTAFQPASAGTTSITLPTTPAGFSTAAQYTQITATVTAPSISSNDSSTGVKLQNLNYYAGYLPVNPPSPVTVTVTISDPTLAILSKTGTAVGTGSVTFTNISNAGYIPPVYVQGLKTGTTTLTVSAPGFTSATSTVTVYPSGFALTSSSFSTTTFSSPSTLYLYTALLSPSSLAVVTYGGNLVLSPGTAAATVALTSSNTSVGTLSPGAVTFNSGDSYQTVDFQPLGAGTTNITLSATPAGFSTPSNYQQAAASVSAPVIQAGAAVTGVNLQTTGYYLVYLPVSPPNPITVTVTSNGPSIATLSTSPTTVGTTTLTFPNITSAGYLPLIYVQGQTVGTTTFTASAPGYTNGSGPITVDPSGFGFNYGSTLTTTAGGSATNLNVYPYILNPGSLTTYSTGLLNPGLGTVAVPVTSSSPATGIIVNSPLLFRAGDAYQTTSFQPLAAGTTTLSVQPPSGFSTPSQTQQITATVQ